MKKILTFLAVAIVAAASQAVSVQWKSGNMYVAADAEGTWATGNANKAKSNVTAVYLIVDQTTYNKYAGKAEDIYKDWSSLQDSALRKSSAIPVNNGGQANWTDSTDVSQADGTIYAIALYSYTHDTYGDFYIANSSSAFVNDLNEVEGVTGSLASSVGKWTAVPSSTPDPIPEPTTVALLALGLVAAGLKRKVA